MDAAFNIMNDAPLQEFLRWTTILNSERLRVNLATYRSAYQSYFVPRIDSYMVASQALYGVSFFVIFFLYFVLIRPIISDMEVCSVHSGSVPPSGCSCSIRHVLMDTMTIPCTGGESTDLETVPDVASPGD